MRLKSAPILLLALASLPAFPAISRGDVTIVPVVSVNDARADFKAGNYASCLDKITAALNSPDKPSVAERAALLTLKAECLLQQKQATPAAEAFTTASQAYADDKKGAAVATATAALIRKSSNFLYAPKTAVDKAPLNILPQKTRMPALVALYRDEQAADQTLFKALTGKTALQPILDFAAKLQDLAALELATADAMAAAPAPAPSPANAPAPVSVTDMETALAPQAKTAIDTSLTTWGKQADAIAASAAQMVSSNSTSGGSGTGATGSTGGGRGGRGGKGGRGGRGGGQAQAAQPAGTTTQKPRGLTDGDKSSLNNLLAQLAKIPPAITTLNSSLTADPDYFKTELADSATLKTKIDGILAGNSQ